MEGGARLHWRFGDSETGGKGGHGRAVVIPSAPTAGREGEWMCVLVDTVIRLFFVSCRDCMEKEDPERFVFGWGFW
jgi:hypothetical protein